MSAYIFSNDILVDACLLTIQIELLLFKNKMAKSFVLLKSIFVIRHVYNKNINKCALQL
jgi:hypothetical protein